jgi:hypothetical protein
MFTDPSGYVYAAHRDIIWVGKVILTSQERIEKARTRRRAYETYHRLNRTPMYLNKLARQQEKRWLKAKGRPTRYDRDAEQRIALEVAVKHGIHRDGIWIKAKRTFPAKCEFSYRLRGELGYSYDMVALVLGKTRKSMPDHALARYWCGWHAVKVDESDVPTNLKEARRYLAEQRVLSNEKQREKERARRSINKACEANPT